MLFVYIVFINNHYHLYMYTYIMNTCIYIYGVYRLKPYCMREICISIFDKKYTKYILNIY